jgi:apolipoprotein N-acyltransferase
MNGTTPYSVLGDWPLFVALLALLAWLGYRTRDGGVNNA